MAALPGHLASFLGARARELIEGLDDEGQRASMQEALSACASMLASLDAIELDRYELSELEIPDLSVWNEVAPQVGAALRAMHDGLAVLARIYPATAPSLAPNDDAFTFDLVEAEDEPLVRAGPTIDRAVEEPVERAVSALVAMLREDVLGFGRRLRDAALVASRSALLGEVQEFRARAAQCVEALSAAVLRPLGPYPLTALLPRYSSELDRSLALRDELATLARDVGAQNARMARADAGTAAGVVNAVMTRLAAFAEHPCCRHLWARDKRELITARRLLRASMDEGFGPTSLRHGVEGLTRFLELLVQSVSKRPEIEAYDQENAALADVLVA